MATRELARFNPFDDTFMANFFGRPMRWPQTMKEDVPTLQNLALDIYEKDGFLMIKAALAGMDAKDVKITYTDQMLTIQGERNEERELKESDYYLKEYTTNSYFRTVRLPPNVKVDAATATFDKGMLTISLPKDGDKKQKTIEVKVQPTT